MVLVCWWLSLAFHSKPADHCRVYRCCKRKNSQKLKTRKEPTAAQLVGHLIEYYTNKIHVHLRGSWSTKPSSGWKCGWIPWFSNHGTRGFMLIKTKPSVQDICGWWARRVTSDSNIASSPFYSRKSRTTRAVSQLRYVIRIAIVTDDSGQIQDFCQAHNAIRSALLNTEWRDQRAARY